MAIKYHPKVGSILMCDFSQGFKEPEMTKKRPVLVVSSIRKRGGLVTVACISTSTPSPVEPYHYLLPKASMPRMKEFQEKESWVKADMIYTVGFQRLDQIRLPTRGADGKRMYYQDRLGREQMQAIRKCLLAGLGIS